MFGNNLRPACLQGVFNLKIDLLAVEQLGVPTVISDVLEHCCADSESSDNLFCQCYL